MTPSNLPSLPQPNRASASIPRDSTRTSRSKEVPRATPLPLSLPPISGIPPTPTPLVETKSVGQGTKSVGTYVNFAAAPLPVLTPAVKRAPKTPKIPIRPIVPLLFSEVRVRAVDAFSKLVDPLLAASDLGTDGNGNGNGNEARRRANLGQNLEISVYNYTLCESVRGNIVRKASSAPFRVAYENRLRSIWRNLVATPGFLASVVDGTITPLAIESMTPIELNFERWKSELDAKVKRDASKYTVKQKATTSMYTCGKCKSTSCVAHAVQIRSADEPQTIFVTCVDCGKHWTN